VQVIVDVVACVDEKRWVYLPHVIENPVAIFAGVSSYKKVQVATVKVTFWWDSGLASVVKEPWTDALTGEDRSFRASISTVYSVIGLRFDKLNRLVKSRSWSIGCQLELEAANRADSVAK